MASSRSDTAGPEAARVRQPRPAQSRGTIMVANALEAVLRTELLCCRAIWGPKLAHLEPTGENAYGETATWLGEDPRDVVGALAACEKVVEGGGRAAAIVGLGGLVDARRKLIELVERRRPLVIHAVITLRGGASATSELVMGHADLHALGDVGVAILAARDAQDAADLSVIAHRAAEDAEAPVVVVHDGWPSSFARDRIVLPDGPLVRAALEPAPPSLGGPGDATLAPHRRAATRIPFALSSAMRAFERHAARTIDAIDAIHVEGADVVLIAAGAVAESACATVGDLRQEGGEPLLGLVQVVVLRPFPGAQIVKAVGRARAVAVIERADEPLAQSNPLTTEVKAAFADALTWAPGYPGIGRIPPIFSACIDPSVEEATSGQLLAVIENVLQGDQGRRAFRVARPGEQGEGVSLPAAAERRVHPAEGVTLRWSGDPTLLLHLLTDLYGGYVRATPRHLGEGDELFDVTFAPTPVRAHHGASELDVVVLHGTSTRAEANELEALALLREGGVVLAVSDEGPSEKVFERLPARVQSEARTRAAHIFAVGGAGTLPRDRAAVLAGALLRAIPPEGLDRAQILADAERALSASLPLAEIRPVLDALARGLETTIETPRA